MAQAARCAADRPAFRQVLRRADQLFIDGIGIGIRIAALLRGCRLRANLVGTNPVPPFDTPGPHRCLIRSAPGASPAPRRARPP